MSAPRSISVDYLARIEGEAAMTLRLKDRKVVDVAFRVAEPPRFFEALLRGRHFTEAPDITSRICGICPVAYQMSAVHAMEDACGIRVNGPLRGLRRLIYCGEWIESHALHITLLHAPDFLGYDGAIEMAKDHPEAVQRGLQIKKVGNDLMALLGGREIHPINIRVGGFYKVPVPRDLLGLTERLKWARDAAWETVRWVARFPFPEYRHDYTFVALRHPGEYPFNEGRLVSNRGLDIPAREFEEQISEEQVPYSTALQATLKDHGPYLTGPLARFNLGFEKLRPIARDAARESGLGTACDNPFKSIIVRAVEVLHACDEALRLIAEYEPPDAPAVEVLPRAGIGYSCTEAPRGVLYHRYRLSADGIILDARIVPPTSQNQKAIEEDLRSFVEPRTELPEERLTRECEQAIRNYDPCISCATHFLKLKRIDTEV